MPLDRFTKVDDILLDLSNFLKTHLKESNSSLPHTSEWKPFMYSFSVELGVGTQFTYANPALQPLDLGAGNLEIIIKEVRIYTKQINNVQPTLLAIRIRDASDNKVVFPPVPDFIYIPDQERWLHLPIEETISVKQDIPLGNISRLQLGLVKEDITSSITLNVLFVLEMREVM